MIKLPFKINLGWSREGIPVFYVFGTTFLPYRLLQFLIDIRWMRIIRKNEKTVIVQLYGQQMKLLNGYFLILAKEWKTWERYCLPDFSLCGQTVLDVGAGCGETAFFYFLYGASKVVAIEPNKEALEYLEENAKRNNWNIEIIPEAFRLEHLNIPHDFMKMDIEGYERELLKASTMETCVVEVHGSKLARKFEEKGFKKIYTFTEQRHLLSFTPKFEEG